MSACEQARGLLEEALKAEPDNARVLQLLGSLELEAENYDDACSYFAAGYKADPSRVTVIQAWARAEAMLGRLGKARHLFRAGLKLDPTNPYLLQVTINTVLSVRGTHVLSVYIQ